MCMQWLEFIRTNQPEAQIGLIELAAALVGKKEK